MSELNERLRTAREAGWSIIPVGKDKKPLFKWDVYQERKPTADELTGWFTDKPAAWAVITGMISDLIIIDFDGEAGKDTMNALGLYPHVETGSGGFHVYIEHPGFKVKTVNGKSKKALGEAYPGLDVRADGGYALFIGENEAGSYIWHREMVPDPADVLPDELRQFLGIDKPPEEAREQQSLPKYERTQEQVSMAVLVDRYVRYATPGNRNNAGFELACQLRDNGYNSNNAEAALRDFAMRIPQMDGHGNFAPYSQTEYMASIRKAYEQPAREPWKPLEMATRIAKRAKPEPPEFKGLLPDVGFLKTYCAYASEITDAPVEFHLAVALSTMSAVLGNQVYITAWGQQLYPNIWSILLAPSGFYRKSTAMKIGLNMLAEANPENLLPNDFTKEKLIENLSAHSQGVVPVWEFGALLSNIGKDYNSGLKEFLTEIYDASFYSRQTKGGSQKIEKPAVSILAGSTIDWVVDRITSGDLRSGWLCRFLYWPATQKNGWKGMNIKHDMEMKEQLQRFLAELSYANGEVEMSPQITEAYNEWLRGHESEVNDQKLPADLQGFYTRIATYVLKFAILYQLSINLTTIITTEALGYAIRLAEYLKVNLIGLIQDDMVTTRDGKELNQLLSIIRTNPGIDRSTLLRKSHLTARKMDDLINTLVQREDVNIEANTCNKNGKNMYVYTSVVG
jgi:hypothetical protein